MQRLWTDATVEPAGLARRGDAAGLLAVIELVTLAYVVAMRVAASVVHGDWRPLAVRFSHSLVPIVLAYVVAVTSRSSSSRGQLGLLRLGSFGLGWDLIGTSDWIINLALLSPATMRYVQVAAIVGHVGGMLADDARSRPVRAQGSGGPSTRARGDGAVHRERAVDPLRMRVLLAHQGGWDEILLTVGLVLGMLGLLAVAATNRNTVRPTSPTPTNVCGLLRRVAHAGRRAVSVVWLPACGVMSRRLPGRSHPPVPPFELTGVHVRGFRSLKDTSFRPGRSRDRRRAERGQVEPAHRDGGAPGPAGRPWKRTTCPRTIAVDDIDRIVGELGTIESR